MKISSRQLDSVWWRGGRGGIDTWGLSEELALVKIQLFVWSRRRHWSREGHGVGLRTNESRRHSTTTGTFKNISEKLGRPIYL